MPDNLRMPSEEQIARAVTVLRTIRDGGNRRPGDDLHLSPDNQEVQLRARAVDILVCMLNDDAIILGHRDV